MWYNIVYICHFIVTLSLLVASHVNNCLLSKLFFAISFNAFKSLTVSFHSITLSRIGLIAKRVISAISDMISSIVSSIFSHLSEVVRSSGISFTISHTVEWFIHVSLLISRELSSGSFIFNSRTNCMSSSLVLFPCAIVYLISSRLDFNSRVFIMDLLYLVCMVLDLPYIIKYYSISDFSVCLL